MGGRQSAFCYLHSNLAVGLPSIKMLDEEKVKRSFHALNNMIQKNLSMIEAILEQTNRNFDQINKNKKEIEDLKIKLGNFLKSGSN